MTIIRAGARERLRLDNRPDGCWASSAGLFVIRVDGTARFDRHYHDVEEFWLIARGAGTVALGDDHLDVTAGDIVHTPPGVEHDIVMVVDELHIFWVSGALPAGSTGVHLHRKPTDATRHTVEVGRRTSR